MRDKYDNQKLHLIKINCRISKYLPNNHPQESCCSLDGQTSSISFCRLCFACFFFVGFGCFFIGGCLFGGLGFFLLFDLRLVLFVFFGVRGCLFGWIGCDGIFFQGCFFLGIWGFCLVAFFALWIFEGCFEGRCLQSRGLFCRRRWLVRWRCRLGL